MTIDKRTRLILSVSVIYIFLFGLTSLIVITTFNSFQNLTINLDKADKVEGLVIDKGRISYRRKYFMTYEATYVIVQGQNKKFGLTESSAFDKVNVGDRLKIFLKKTDEDLNLEIYQMEKDGDIILDKTKFESTERNVFIVGLLGSIIMLGTTTFSISRIKFDQFRE